MSLLCCAGKGATDAGEPRGGGGQNEMDKPAPPAATMDPRIGLNPRQIFILTKNWKGISRQMEATGMNMFIRLFERNEELYGLFKKLRHLKPIPKEQMIDDEALEQHATSVMTVFDNAIQAIGTPDEFFKICAEYGALHATKPGFKADIFWKMEEPFIYALKITLDDRYTDNMDEIYTKIIHLILETMVKACAKAAPSTNTDQVEVDVS